MQRVVVGREHEAGAYHTVLVGVGSGEVGIGICEVDVGAHVEPAVDLASQRGAYGVSGKARLLYYSALVQVVARE